jgi:ribonuclease D
MIYLVSRNKSLFGSERYKQVPFEEAMALLLPLHLVQFDTETKGLDAHTKELLTVQLGCRESQVVFDWTTMSKEEKLEMKKYFESDRTFLGWNLLFDLGFLYVQDIWPNNIWDGMIAEKLIWLGYPAGMREMSLKAAAYNYLNYDLDKTVRGKIINDGLTEDVVVYAAGDVCTLKILKTNKK